MNRDEARRVLAERARLNHLPYGPDMVEAWANALHDVTEADALAAVTGLVRDGVQDVTAARVNTWLREQRRAERRDGMAKMSIEVGCGCTFATICDDHRSVGLAAIKHIKQEMPAGRPWSLVKPKGGLL